MNASLLVAAMVLAGSPAGKEFGAVSQPVMPRGGLSVYGLGGWPELRAGFRQGLADVEIGAEAGLDYLRMLAWGAVEARRPLLAAGALGVAAEGKAGLFGNAGARFEDRRNTASAGLRLELGSYLSYQTSWPVALQASARLPVEVPLTFGGAWRVCGLLGGGAEVAISPDHYVVVNGGFGPDLRWPAFGSSRASLAVEAMVGFGYRVF